MRILLGGGSINSSRLVRFLTEANRIVFFTGEGLGKEIGIEDFRTLPTDIFTEKILQEDPIQFYSFCLQHLYRYRDFEPGEGHLAIAKFEKYFPEKRITVITQNVDGLHQKAGNSNVVELHGNLRRLVCPKCLQVFSSDYLDAAPGVPKCTCRGTLRPDMVLFHEDIPLGVFFNALDEIRKADLIVVVGSGLRVFPANTLIEERGKLVPLVMVNTQLTGVDRQASLLIYKKAGPVLHEALRYMTLKVV